MEANIIKVMTNVIERWDDPLNGRVIWFKNSKRLKIRVSDKHVIISVFNKLYSKADIGIYNIRFHDDNIFEIIKRIVD